MSDGLSADPEDREGRVPEDVTEFCKSVIRGKTVFATKDQLPLELH